MSAVRRLLGEAVVPAATLVLALLVWEAATWAFRIPRFIMPAPSAILGEGWEWRYRFIEHTWVTLYETLGGFALSMAVGVPLAVLIVYSPRLRGAIYPLIVLTQSVPKIAIAPVLLLVLGFGEIPKMVVAFLVAFFPVVVDTATGLAATPPELLDLSRSYRASAFKTFMKVRLPLALPFIFAGAKVAITLSVIGAVVGEFEQAAAEGKPENVQEKIVEGRLNKWVDVVVLLNQTHINDEKHEGKMLQAFP